MVSSAAPVTERVVVGTAAQARTRTTQRAILISIVAIAALVRVWGLGGQPVLYFDSGVYLGEGAFLASVAQRAAAALTSPGAASPLERAALAVQDGTDAHPPDIAKPGHAILLAIAMLLMGKSALAGALVSALAGIGTVVATYAIGMRGWGPRVAIPAALLLAVSGQHLVYSREPLVEGDALLYATLAALVYLHARGARGLLAAGLLWGLAFACNNRIAYLPAVFVIAELSTRPSGGLSGMEAQAAWLSSVIRRGGVLAIGFLAPLALIEVAYLAARGVGRAAGARTDWLDYLQQLAAFSRMNPPDRVRLDQWPTYLVDLSLMDGLAVTALMLIGLGVLGWRLRRRPWSRADLLLAGSLLVPLVLYSVYSTGEVRLRHFSLALPWVMLAAALALERLAGLFRRRERIALAGVLGALVLAAIPRVVALDTAPSGMPAVLSAVGSGAAASTNGPVLAFYLGEDRTNGRLREAFVNVPSDLTALAQRFPILVVDMQAEVFAGDLTDLYARTPPRLVVPNGNDAWYLADLLEHYGSAWGGWDELLAKRQANRVAASELRVYDLSALIAAMQ